MGGKDDYAGYAAGGSNVFRIPSNISVSLGLQWDFVGENPVDLDASCVAFDAEGMVVETIFFNNLTSEGGYMIHTGDNQTGEDEGEDDESLIFHMSKIPPEVKYLMVCVTSYTGADFTYVEKARVRVVNLATKEPVGGFHLGVVGRHTATLLCAFSRVPNEAGEEDTSNAGWWDLREINIACYGFTFCDVIPKMLDLLGVPRDEHDAHLANLPDFSLEKKDPMWELVLSNIKFGLGWDGENDLDASMVMLDSEGKYVDHLHAKYGRLRCGGFAEQDRIKLIEQIQQQQQQRQTSSGNNSPDGTFATNPNSGGENADNNEQQHLQSQQSFTFDVNGNNIEVKPGDEDDPTSLLSMMRQPVADHSGDKLNGFDADGDDEYITVDLMRVDPRVHVVYFMVILYDGVAKHLSEVPKCYARFLNKKNSGSSKASGSFKEVDRLPISQLIDDESHTVLVPYAVYRKTHSTWALVSVSELMSGRDWVDVFPFLRAFTALGVSCEKWADWKRDIAPFAVRITIRRIRDLAPVEPHQFSCRCMAWVQDRHGVGRFKTSICNKRDNIEFGESCTFFVDKLDVVRIMVFEHSMVGHVDIPMAEFFPLSPPALSLAHMCYESANNAHPPGAAAGGVTSPMNHNNNNPNMSTTGTREYSFPSNQSEQNNNNNHNNDQEMSVINSTTTTNRRGGGGRNSPGQLDPEKFSLTSPTMNNNTMNGSPFGSVASPGSMRLQQQAGSGHHHHQQPGGRPRPVMDGETMLDAWLPLSGIGISGQIQVLLERVPLVDAIKEETKKRKALSALADSGNNNGNKKKKNIGEDDEEEEGGSSSCVVA